MTNTPADQYWERARQLSAQDAERLFSRMNLHPDYHWLNHDLDPLESLAKLLAVEDEALSEWRDRWNELSAHETQASQS